MGMNWYPTDYAKRIGCYGFLSAIVMLWRLNRNAKELGIKSKIELTLPLRWFR